MGGMDYILTKHTQIAENDALINIHTLRAAREAGVQRYFFPSTACVYPIELQDGLDVLSLKEDQAIPAHPEGGYGWEKLFFEQLCQHCGEDYDIEMRIARFHNVYGPYSFWRGTRAKAPAALCRKIAFAKLSGDPTVEIWGDGKQRRSFMYIDDCVEGIMRLMESDFHGPLNLGRDRAVSINELAGIIAGIAGIEIIKKHVIGQQGVRSRNSDNTLCKEVLGWSPSTTLEEGLVPTYEWIEKQVWNYD